MHLEVLHFLFFGGYWLAHYQQAVLVINYYLKWKVNENTF
jgi:hypothetical protein